MTDPADWPQALRDGPPVLVTGAAGFIGHHLAERLLAAGVPVHGIDNLSDYYDVRLKEARLEQLRGRNGFAFERLDLADREGTEALFARLRPAHVVHLAAQAGVRYSIENPRAYGDANLSGFLNVLEGCRAAEVRHLVYASSSSVYGGNTKVPFSVHDGADHPVSLYAATKRSNELMAHAYSHLYGLPATGLRFFTVYGPWGRPDMAVFKFTQAILAGQPIQVFNRGDMERDFTYVDDIVEGVARIVPHLPAPDPDFDTNRPDPATSWAPHRLYNIGNHRRERLGNMIATLERLLGRKADRQLVAMQPGDVKATWADVSDLEAAVGFAPDTPLETGLRRFVEWYREYYQV